MKSPDPPRDAHAANAIKAVAMIVIRFINVAAKVVMQNELCLMPAAKNSRR